MGENSRLKQQQHAQLIARYGVNTKKCYTKSVHFSGSKRALAFCYLPELDMCLQSSAAGNEAQAPKLTYLHDIDQCVELCHGSHDKHTYLAVSRLNRTIEVMLYNDKLDIFNKHKVPCRLPPIYCVIDVCSWNYLWSKSFMWICELRCLPSRQMFVVFWSMRVHWLLAAIGLTFWTSRLASCEVWS